jgi:uncharacterized Tic20 family protein
MTFLIIIIYALGVLFNIVGVIISAIDNKEENIVEIQLKIIFSFFSWIFTLALVITYYFMRLCDKIKK